MDEIQKVDYDRFISSVFIDKEYRGQVATIIKLNIELSRIKNKVSDPNLGLIRLQWWKDAILSLYDKNQKTESFALKNELKELISNNKQLIKSDFIDFIEGRELDFEQHPFHDLTTLKEYLSKTATQLNLMIAKTLDIQKEELATLHKIIDNISIAWGITAIVRSAGHNYHKGRAVFPTDIAEKHNLNSDQFGSFDFIKTSQPIVKELLEEANNLLSKTDHFDKYNSNIGTSKDCFKKIKFLRVYKHLANRHIRKISNNKFDVFSKGYNVPLGFFDLTKIYMTQ